VKHGAKEQEELMTLEVINNYVRQGFAKAGLTTSQALHDDEKVCLAARTIISSFHLRCEQR
jgi:hypothetical protein